MRNRPTLAVPVGLAAFATTAPAHPPNLHFRGVGDLPGGAFLSRAFDVEYHPETLFSPSGVTVVGESEGASGVRAFRWSPSTGIEDLGVLEPEHTFSSASAPAYWGGSIIVGSSGTSPAEQRAFFWEQGKGMTPVGPPSGGSTPVTAHAQIEDISTACVGQAVTPGGLVAYVGGPGFLIAMPSLGGVPEESAALDANWNGNRRAGYSRDPSGRIQAFYWTSFGGTQGIGFLNPTGFQESRARAINYFGDVVVGESSSLNGPIEAFRWPGPSGTMVGLGDLPGGAFRSAALAVNWGNAGISSLVIVGWSEAADGERAFIWTEAAGMRDLNAVLAGSGYNFAGWTLRRATGISAKGKAIAGIGINPLGQTEGWVAYASCYHDCNGDLQKSVADFACFQTKFVAGHPYADCDDSGGLTVADFGCFQTAFVGASNCNEQ